MRKICPTSFFEIFKSEVLPEKKGRYKMLSHKRYSFRKSIEAFDPLKKRLLVILFIFSKVYAQDIIKDTIMSGIYNANGKVMYIKAKISGKVTIQNAIIEANPYIQIFDTTVILQNCKSKEFSTAWYGAKKSNADNSIHLQKSIDVCIANGFQNLYFADSYTYSQSLKVFFLYKGSYSGFALNIYGDGDAWSSRTTLTYTGKSFAMGVQLAKGGKISNLNIAGTQYITPGNTGIAYYNTPFPTGTSSGLVIDYDGSKNVSGSTALLVENINISGFDVLYNISPNGVTSSADALTFTNVRCGNGRIGFQSGQAQEKGNQINNIISWGNLQTLISIGKSGKWQAGQYIIRNGNIAGSCVQLFDVQLNGWNGFDVDGLFAEGIARLGTISANNSVYVPTVSLDKMHIRFAVPTQAATQTLLVSNAPKLKISNSELWFYNGVCCQQMNFSGAMIFDNVDFGKGLVVNPNATYIKPIQNSISSLLFQEIKIRGVDQQKSN